MSRSRGCWGSSQSSQSSQSSRSSRVVLLGGLLLAVLALAQLGCARRGQQQDAAVAAFPDRAELSAIASKPAPPLPEGKQRKAVSTWQLGQEVPLDFKLIRRAPSSPLEQRMAALPGVQQGRGVLTAAMHCAAREAGRFFMQHGAEPDQRLWRWMVARCGSPTPGAVLVTAVEPAAKVPDEQSLALQQGNELMKAIATVLQSGQEAKELGVWFGSVGEYSVVALTMAPRTLDVSSATPAPDQSGSIALAGRVLGPADYVSVAINQGEWGVAECRGDPRVQPPAFRAYCPMAPGDASAWVEVYAGKRNRVLSATVGQVLASRPNAPSLEYRANVSATAGGVAPAQLPGVVLQRLNAVRQRAGMRPLVLAPQQTRTAQKVAPHLLAASSGGDEALADKIAMGLLAGWDVQGMLRGGNLISLRLGGTRDPVAWVDYAIDRPMGRRTLLDPEAEQLALGGAMAQNTIAAVAATYSTFAGVDHAKDARALFQRLAYVRSSLGLAPPHAVPANRGSDAAWHAVSKVAAGKSTIPEAAKEAGMAVSRAHGGRAVWTFSGETIDPMLLEFPPELLRPAPPVVAIAITHRKVPGAAWGQYVVVVVGLVTDGSDRAQLEQDGLHVVSTAVAPRG